MNFNKVPSVLATLVQAMFFALLLTIFISCKDQNKKQEVKSIQVTDDLGRKVSLQKVPQRIMALSPAMTEMLFAVCPDSQIVAVTHICNYPEAVDKKPEVSTYPLDLEGIVMHQPELIFAEEGMTSLDNAERINDLGIPVYFASYRKVEDIFKTLQTIGSLTGNEERANKLVDSLKREKQILEKQSENLEKPDVLAITWIDPIIVHGFNTIMTDKLKLAGASNAVKENLEKNYPELSREYILKMNPDVIIGGSFEGLDATLFTIYPELKQIKAYKNKRVYNTTDDLTSRPSPRVLESVKELKRLIHSK